jgi:NADH-quinone oxidoreductase subunit H
MFDQAFVDLKHWFVELLPLGMRPIVSVVLSIAPMMGVFATLFAATTWIERKALGRIQNRYGPNRVGPFGLLQPAADGLKTLTKENIVPRDADRLVHFLAPLALLIPVFLSYSVLPIGRNMVGIDLDAGLLFFFAVGSGTELAVFMAGWSSRNKYALLGAMRGIAQMVSYELPLILSAVPVVMMVGSLSTVQIVEAQGGGIGNWFVATPWGLAGFLLFFVAATAESNRTPFDLPEAESELIAGYFTEYSGFKFALFFLGEYLGLFAISGLAITLYLGGWQAPAPFFEIIPSWAWFFIKLLGFIMMFIWLRGTLPRLRIDQLMGLAWKFLLPLALINLLNVALWRFLGPGLLRWVVCALVITAPYVLLGRGLQTKVGKRTYRYAS